MPGIREKILNHTSSVIEEYILQELLMLKVSEERLCEEIAHSSENGLGDVAKGMAALKARMDMLEDVLDGMEPQDELGVTFAYTDVPLYQELRCA